MRKLKFIFFLVALLISSSCNAINPIEKIEFPKTDIVYQAITYHTPGEPFNNIIGFINADSSENVLLKIKYRAHQPVFSKEWDGVFFLQTRNPVDITPSDGYVFFLSSNGEYKNCDSKSTQVYSKFIFPLNIGKHIVVTVDEFNIQLFSIDNCQIIKTLIEYSNNIQNFFIDSAFPSNAGDKVIFSVYDRSLDSHIIKSVDVNTGEIKDIFQGGYNPSFSPDDKEIAYLESDGIYIADLNGSNQHKLVPLSFKGWSAMPIPLWSPDGRFLIYHKCTKQICTEELFDYSIYKADAKTGKETKVIDQGLFPVWIK